MKTLLTYIVALFSLYSTAQSITAAEYFFNSDPGVGNGTILVVDINSGQLTQKFSIPITGLSEGFHSFYIRTKNNENNWSLYHREIIYIKTLDISNITAAEYFYNTDPGVGNATALDVDGNSGQLTQKFSIPTTGLAEGFHSFYIRTQNTNGNWSLYHREIIYIKSFEFVASAATAAEYFIDTDPGVGRGTFIQFEDSSQSTQILSVPTTGLAEGDHVFYIRVQNQKENWSIYDKAIFTINGNLSIEDSLYNLTAIYPNPFLNNLTIIPPKHVSIEKIQIYDFNGRSVYQNNNDSLTNYDLSFLTQGVYLLKLFADGKTATFKILKQ